MSEYISLTEYCKKYGKQKAAMLRLIYDGRLEAEKVGNQWVIPADAPAPVDLRVKNGDYIGWHEKYGKGRKKEKKSETDI